MNTFQRGRKRGSCSFSDAPISNRASDIDPTSPTDTTCFKTRSHLSFPTFWWGIQFYLILVFAAPHASSEDAELTAWLLDVNKRQWAAGPMTSSFGESLRRIVGSAGAVEIEESREAGSLSLSRAPSLFFFLSVFMKWGGR